MSKKRKRRFKLFRFLLVIAILVFVYSYFSKEIKDFINNISFEKVVNKKNNNDVLNDQESDIDVVDYEFADGMSLEEYEKILYKKSNYIKSTHEYENLSYDFSKKLRYSEIESYLNRLNYSDIVKLEVIGTSVDGRDIYNIEIGTGKKKVVIDSNIHAAEVGNTPILIQFLTELVNNYESNDSTIVEMLNNVKLVVLPCINPDGYEVYNFGIESLKNKNLWMYKNKSNIDFTEIKSNANGIDINRNMPTQNAGLLYKGETLLNNVSLEKTTKNGTYFGGTSLGSEPETKALMYFMLKHYKDASSYINMHSMGRVLYAGKPNLSDEFNDLCESFGNGINSINDYALYGLNTEEVGEGNDGTATDFMSELAHGFKFSEVTGRLSSTTYKNNDSSLLYKYPVITMETLKTYTDDVDVFEKEYYNNKLKDVLYSFIK